MVINNKPLTIEGEKLEGLKTYKKAQKEKEDYQREMKRLEQEEFAKSKLGKVIKYGNKPQPFVKRSLPAPTIGENLTKEQRFLGDLFGGNGTLGRGHNLPRMNRTLFSGGGLIKNGDDGETGNMFGMRRRVFA